MYVCQMCWGTRQDINTFLKLFQELINLINVLKSSISWQNLHTEKKNTWNCRNHVNRRTMCAQCTYEGANKYRTMQTNPELWDHFCSSEQGKQVNNVRTCEQTQPAKKCRMMQMSLELCDHAHRRETMWAHANRQWAEKLWTNADMWNHVLSSEKG